MPVCARSPTRSITSQGLRHRVPLWARMEHWRSSTCVWAGCRTVLTARLQEFSANPHRAADLLAGSTCSSVTWGLFVFLSFSFPFLCFSLLVFPSVPTFESPPKEHQPTERDALCLDQPKHPCTHISLCTCTDVHMHIHTPIKIQHTGSLLTHTCL